MTAEAFRRDPSLRASGYLLWVWGAVNFVLPLPLWAAWEGSAWSSGWIAAHLALCLALGLWLSILAASRAGKLCGEAAARPIVEARRLWLPILAAGAVITLPALLRGETASVLSAWMAIAGAGHLAWGAFTIPELRALGGALLVAGAVAGGGASGWILVLWWVAMGLLWGVTGLRINRRYVFSRE